MRFWDSSAIVPLLVNEISSSAVLRTYERDPEMAVWWAAQIECVAALARHERDGTIGAAGMANAIARLDALLLAWREVQPVEPVRRLATRLLRVHPVRTGDALQLAAALAAAEDRADTLAFVTLDERLALAAQREGFPVVQPSAE
jgi:hypothetical protein